jgi:hypothetical protein
MSIFINTDEDDAVKKMNIDDLFIKKQRRDLKQLSIYNKLLNRIHKRITTTSRSRSKDTHIWFNVPEFIFGEPVYDNADCTGYLVAKLEENGFHVRYMHPNTLFVSWENWIPSYVRSEIKKKTGVVIDEKGNIKKKASEEEEEDNDINSMMLTGGQTSNGNNKPQKQYTDTKDYKPTGKLVYNPEILETLEKKVSFR